jgi:phosphoribosylformylglycinamidine (FGAM) synthase PurS component
MDGSAKAQAASQGPEGDADERDQATVGHSETVSPSRDGYAKTQAASQGPEGEAAEQDQDAMSRSETVSPSRDESAKAQAASQGHKGETVEQDQDAGLSETESLSKDVLKAQAASLSSEGGAVERDQVIKGLTATARLSKDESVKTMALTASLECEASKQDWGSMALAATVSIPKVASGKTATASSGHDGIVAEQDRDAKRLAVTMSLTATGNLSKDGSVKTKASFTDPEGEAVERAYAMGRSETVSPSRDGSVKTQAASQGPECGAVVLDKNDMGNSGTVSLSKDVVKAQAASPSPEGGAVGLDKNAMGHSGTMSLTRDGCVKGQTEDSQSPEGETAVLDLDETGHSENGSPSKDGSGETQAASLGPEGGTAECDQEGMRHSETVSPSTDGSGKTQEVSKSSEGVTAELDLDAKGLKATATARLSKDESVMTLALTASPECAASKEDWDSMSLSATTTASLPKVASGEIATASSGHDGEVAELDRDAEGLVPIISLTVTRSLPKDGSVKTKASFPDPEGEVAERAQAAIDHSETVSLSKDGSGKTQAESTGPGGETAETDRDAMYLTETQSHAKHEVLKTEPVLPPAWKMRKPQPWGDSVGEKYPDVIGILKTINPDIMRNQWFHEMGMKIGIGISSNFPDDNAYSLALPESIYSKDSRFSDDDSYRKMAVDCLIRQVGSAPPENLIQFENKFSLINDCLASPLELGDRLKLISLGLGSLGAMGFVKEMEGFYIANSLFRYEAKRDRGVLTGNPLDLIRADSSRITFPVEPNVILENLEMIPGLGDWSSRQKKKETDAGKAQEVTPDCGSTDNPAAGETSEAPDDVTGQEASSSSPETGPEADVGAGQETDSKNDDAERSGDLAFQSGSVPAQGKDIQEGSAVQDLPDNDEQKDAVKVSEDGKGSLTEAEKADRRARLLESTGQSTGIVTGGTADERKRISDQEAEARKRKRENAEKVKQAWKEGQAVKAAQALEAAKAEKEAKLKQEEQAKNEGGETKGKDDPEKRLKLARATDCVMALFGGQVPDSWWPNYEGASEELERIMPHSPAVLTAFLYWLAEQGDIGPAEKYLKMERMSPPDYTNRSIAMFKLIDVLMKNAGSARKADLALGYIRFYSNCLRDKSMYERASKMVEEGKRKKLLVRKK